MNQYQKIITLPFDLRKGFYNLDPIKKLNISKSIKKKFRAHFELKINPHFNRSKFEASLIMFIFVGLPLAIVGLVFFERLYLLLGFGVLLLCICPCYELIKHANFNKKIQKMIKEIKKEFKKYMYIKKQFSTVSRTCFKSKKLNYFSHLVVQVKIESEQKQVSKKSRKEQVLEKKSFMEDQPIVEADQVKHIKIRNSAKETCREQEIEAKTPPNNGINMIQQFEKKGQFPQVDDFLNLSNKKQ